MPGILFYFQLLWPRRYVPLINGAPSHDTFRHVFVMLSPARWAPECDVCLSAEMNRGRWEERGGIAVPVDEWLPKAFRGCGLQSITSVIRRTMRQSQGADTRPHSPARVRTFPSRQWTLRPHRR